DLPGLTTREVAVVANVARYHRLAEPKRDHPGYAKLAREDRRLVRALAGILRVADGLDRTHGQSVRKVGIGFEEDRAGFTVKCEVDCAVDIWGAERKSGLFEKEFGYRVRFECEPLSAPEPPVVVTRSTESVLAHHGSVR